MRKRATRTIPRILPPLLALTLALMLTVSCDFLNDSLDAVDEVDIPLRYSSDIAGQLQVILVRSDLDDDGHIQGTKELLELLKQLYQAVRELIDAEDPGDS